MSKNKRKRQITTIALLAVLLIGLGAGYFFLSKSNREKEAAEAETKNTTVDLYEIDKEKVAKIRYKNELSELSMVKKEDKWVREGREDVPMNQEYVNAMLGELETVTASNRIQMESNDLSQYGLDNPLLEVNVTMEDGTQYDMVMGMEVPTDNGHYSIVGGDEGTIYILPILLFNKFKYSETEMIQIEDEFEVNVENVTHFSLEREGKEPFEIQSIEQDEGWKVNYYKWSIRKPYPKEVMADTINIKEFFGGFTSLTFDECVEYGAQDVKQYGLDKPKATMRMEYYDVVGSEEEEGSNGDAPSSEEEGKKEEVREDKSYTLLIGDKKDEESYYVKLEGSNHVYLLSSTVVEPILELDIFHVSDQCVFLGMVTDMSGYEFTIDGKTHTVVRQEEKKPKEDASDGSEESDGTGDAKESDGEEQVEHIYHVDGQLVDSTEFVNIFSATYLLEVSGLADGSVKPESEEPVLSLTYHMLTGEDVVLKFLPYDGSNFYRVYKDGEDYFLTDKRGVDDIVRRYSEFVEKLK